MNFIQEIMDSTIELEPPRSFFFWSALAAISATVMDNVWLPRGEQEGTSNVYYNTYPNIYVMLYAGSALKKGPPVSLAKDLVKKATNGLPRIISGRSSIQAMLKELGTSYTQPGGKVISKSAAFIASSEFSSSIVEDKAAMTILTDLYDRNWNEGDWKSLLKQEEFTLKDPILTLLAATNPAHFDDFISQKDVHGGFVGRMFVIVEKESSTLNSLVSKLKRVPDKDKLAAYLKQVALLKGPFTGLADTPAGEYYNDWYMNFFNTIKDQKIEDPTGTIGRFGESVIKIAMLLQLAQEPKLGKIDLHIMEAAVLTCDKLIGNVRSITHGKKGKATNLELKTLIMNEFLEREPHMVSREILMKKYWMHYSNADEFNETMGAFHDSGMIEVQNSGTVVYYVMKDSEAQKLKDHLGGKKGQG